MAGAIPGKARGGCDKILVGGGFRRRTTLHTPRRGCSIAWDIALPSSFRLLRPIIGFCPMTNWVVTIPAGTTLTLERFRGEPGVCSAYWNGQAIYAQSVDIEENSVVVFSSATRTGAGNPRLGQKA